MYFLYYIDLLYFYKAFVSFQNLLLMAPTSSTAPFGSSQQASAETSSTPVFNRYPRMLSLDVLRGIALLGALFISIWVFGGFSANQQNGLLLQSKGWNYRLFGTVNLLLEGKMRALISVVFGAGMVVLLARENQKGQLSTADLFIRRQLWLIFFGLVNALLLLWTGDVLFHLGIMGILLFPFVRLSARGLLIAAVIITFIYSAKNYWSYADNRTAYRKYQAVVAFEKKLAKDSIKNASLKQGKKDSLSKEQQNDKQAWEGIVNNLKYDPKKDEAEKAAMQVLAYGKIWNHLLPVLQAKESQWAYSFGIWDFAGMMLLGMALFKIGFFSSRFSKMQYLLIAIAGITAGLLLGWFRSHYNQLALQDYVKYINRYRMPFNLFFPFERAVMAVGYASLVLFFIAIGFLNVLWRALAAAGRMALTNYLLQSVICTLFFVGFGMGYYKRLEQQQLYLFAAEVCMVQIVFSVFWLRYYQAGPVEWLWRCLTYGTWLPNKIRKPDTTEPVMPALF